MHIAILGAGAFGTALASALHGSGLSVVLWSRNSEVVASLAAQGENCIYLPGHQIPREVTVTSDIKQAISGASALLLCVPAQELRNLCNVVAKAVVLAPDVAILACSKGIELTTRKFASEVVAESFPRNPIFVLSGPALASEIARGLPCTMVLAGENTGIAELLSRQLSMGTLCITSSSDFWGVQIGAVLKNIVAIACGIVLGKGIGYNASAMVIMQGLAEMQAMCIAKTGTVNVSTMTGPACIGDLVLTCTTPSSRNMSFGLAIGKGEDFAKKGSTVLVEGAASADAVCTLASALGIELPICSAVSELLGNKLNVDQFVQKVLHPTNGGN